MFTIVRGSLCRIKITLVKPFVTSFGSLEEREVIAVSLETKEGVVGWGEAPILSLPLYNPEIPESVIGVIGRVIFPRLNGASFENPQEVDAALAFIRGNEFAKSAVLMAIYDIYGKLLNRRVVDCIGGTKQSVKISTTISVHERVADAVTEAKSYYDAGVRFLKLKVKPGYDYEQASAVRAAFPDAKLMLDANASYALSPETIAAFKKCDALGLYCIEQPLQPYDLIDHAKLQRELATPLALDESVESLYDAEKAIELKSCKLVNVKIPRVGGLMQALAINALCAEHHIPTWVGGMLESPLGFYANLALASVSNFDYPIDFLGALTYMRDYTKFFTRLPFEIKGDSLNISLSGSGFGFELDWKIFDRYVTERIPLV